jgi:hypothetical protein
VLIRSARITLKQHRFEVAVAAIAATLLGARALWVNLRLADARVPAGCFDAWLNTAGEVGAECDALFRAFSKINGEEAGPLFGAMAVLPWLAGLLTAVTLIGRELEARTAQTAWALAASRGRWFARQLWPIVLVVGVTVGFAAVAASILSATRSASDPYVWLDLGARGPIVVARTVAALGVGLLAGAAIGRTLPAFIIGALLSVALVTGSTAARAGWVNLQPRVVYDQATVDRPGFRAGLIFEQGWRLPNGTVLTETEATALAAADGSFDPYDWLLEQGYEVVQLGITAATARGWEPLEFVGFVLVGTVLVAAAMVVVDRRRPT